VCDHLACFPTSHAWAAWRAASVDSPTSGVASRVRTGLSSHPVWRRRSARWGSRPLRQSRPSTSARRQEPEDDDGRTGREPQHRGVRSLEVRWIFPGELSAVVAGWFARFQAETAVLEDAYLLDPHLPGLSVKVREGRALEVRVYRGSPGFSRWRDVRAVAWSPGRSGPFLTAQPAWTVVTWLAGCR
jgi:hypothetical protein